ncbi:MAG: peptide ABC transporter substrate-binding protein, partial [Haliea sp.]
MLPASRLLLALIKLIAVAMLGLATVLPSLGSALARDTLVIGVQRFPSSFHPNFEVSVVKSFILGMTRRPITARDKDWNLVCLLCAQVPDLVNGLAELDAHGGGGVRLKLVLRRDAVWGDGMPITTRDVEFTWQVGRHPLSGTANAGLFENIARIDIIDDKTAILHLTKFSFDYADLSEFMLLPEHVERVRFESNPAEYRHRSKFVTSIADKGLYFGPYLIADVVPGSHVVLNRNPLWWGRTPTFDKVVVRAVEDTGALMANLLSGDVDMIPGEGGISINQAVFLEQNYRDEFQIIFQPGFRFEHIDLNLDNRILQNSKVRRALLLAIDREKTFSSIFGDHYTMAETTVSPVDTVYADEIPGCPFDPARAARLLDQAGWKLSPGGIRRNSAGEPLALEVVTTAGHHTREMILQAFQSQWRAVGIDVRLKPIPARLLFGEILPKRKFTGMAMYAYVTTPEWVPRPVFGSANVPTKLNNWSGYNFTGYRNTALDVLLDRIEREFDFDKRRD